MLEVGVQSARWYNREDPDGSFAFIRSCGFEAVDFNIDHYLSVSTMVKTGQVVESIFDKEVAEVLLHFAPLKEASEKHGVKISQMHSPFPIWIPGNTELTDHVIMAVEKCLEVCKYVNCPALVVHPDRNLDKNVEYENNMALYRRLIPAVKKTGVKVCLENLPGRMNDRLVDGVCSTGEEVCRYIDTLNAEAGCEAFGYCFDVGHANIMGSNMRDHLKKVGNRLTVMHIHDNNGITDWHTAPYTCVSSGGHQLDWEGLLQGLKEINYRGSMCFETFRVLRHLPQALHKDMLKYIAAVGHYFKDQILSE